jgi:alpha-glucosidase
VITGEDLPAVRRKYMELVGKPPMPPRAVFYPWIVDDEEPNSASDALLQISTAIRAVKSEYSEIPSFGFLFNAVPNAQLFRETAALNAELMVREHPYVFRNSENYEKMAGQGYLVRSTYATGPPVVLNYNRMPAALVDYTFEAAAQYWHSISRAENFMLGAKFFQLISGEPEVYSSLAWYRGWAPLDVPASSNGTQDNGVGSALPQSLSAIPDALPSDAPITAGTAAAAPRSIPHSHYFWANPFSLKWMESIYKNSLNLPESIATRKFLMTRAGLPGLARFGAGLYSTEPAISFPETETLVRSHLSLVGVDYYTTDLIDTLKLFNFELDWFKTLYQSWTARNLLLNFPFIIPKTFVGEPWLRELLNLKYKLEPYYYSLAWQATLNGDPIVAPLSYYFQHIPEARNRGHEVMLGPNILVGTMGFLMGQEHITEVFAPRGKWYDYFGGKIIEIVDYEKSVLRMNSKYQGHFVPPVLIREGAIIPTWDTPADFPGRLKIKIFPGDTKSSFLMYEDDGTTLRYANSQEYVTTLFELDPEAEKGTITFTIRARKGSLPGEGEPVRPFYLEFIGIGNVRDALLDGGELSRVNKIEDFYNSSSSYFSLGYGRLLLKTLNLDLTQDHSLVIHYANVDSDGNGE